MTTYHYHNPVLLKESVEGLNIKPDGTYVDVTFGGGGHSRAILKQLNEAGRLFAFDQDEDARLNAINDSRFTLINENFRFVKRYLKFYGIQKVDGVLGDFGVSSHQFDVAERGFSTSFEAPLDMRMNTKGSLSAFHVVNEYELQELSTVFRLYGELKNAWALANAILKARNVRPIKSSEELKAAIQKLLPKFKENKMLAQIYQAIRIEVNQEITVLKELLLQLPDIVKKGGRISLISYHSLEDRLVKRFIRDGKFEGEAEKDFYGNINVPFKKIGGLIVPGKEEIEISL